MNVIDIRSKSQTSMPGCPEIVVEEHGFAIGGDAAWLVGDPKVDIPLIRDMVERQGFGVHVMKDGSVAVTSEKRREDGTKDVKVLGPDEHFEEDADGQV